MQPVQHNVHSRILGLGLGFELVGMSGHLILGLGLGFYKDRVNEWE